VSRLGAATRPYLVQHAGSGVPVLLSVRYAAYRWCHEVPRLAAVSGVTKPHQAGC